MYRSQALGIAHHVAERNQGVHFVLWRLLCATFHLEIVQYQIESLIITHSDVAFQAHQFIYLGGLGNSICECFYPFDERGEVFTPTVIIVQVFDHVGRGTLDELLSQCHTLFLVLME